MSNKTSVKIAFRDREDATFQSVTCRYDEEGDLAISSGGEGGGRWTITVAREDLAKFTAGLVLMMEAGK